MFLNIIEYIIWYFGKIKPWTHLPFAFIYYSHTFYYRKCRTTTKLLRIGSEGPKYGRRSAKQRGPEENNGMRTERNWASTAFQSRCRKPLKAPKNRMILLCTRMMKKCWRIWTMMRWLIFLLPMKMCRRKFWSQPRPVPKWLVKRSGFCKNWLIFFLQKTFKLCFELRRCIPNSQIYTRKNVPMKKVVKQAIQHQFTDIIVVHEDNKKPSKSDWVRK